MTWVICKTCRKYQSDMICIISPINHFSNNLPSIVAVLEVPIWVCLQERTCCSAVKDAVSLQPPAVSTLGSTAPLEQGPCSSWGGPQPMTEHRVGTRPGQSLQHATPLMSNLCSGIPRWVGQNDSDLHRDLRLSLSNCTFSLFYLHKCYSPQKLLQS